MEMGKIVIMVTIRGLPVVVVKMKLSLLAVVVAAVVAASRFQDDTVGKGHGLSECLVSISPSSTMFHLDLDHHWCW